MKTQKKSSNLPYVIILIVLAAIVFAVLWGTGIIGGGSSTGNKSVANTNSPNGANTARPGLPTTAPAGAPIGVNMLGSPTAAVTIEEFADFQCGACAQAHPVLKEIQAVYGSRIKFVFRHYPLQMHDKAFDAAVAVEAAGMQGSGKFWQMQDQLFRNQQAWATDTNYRETWTGYAQSIGLDIEKFKADTAGLPAKSRVEQDLQRARGLGVGSTPTVYVNGQSIPFPQLNVQTLRQVIDAEFQRAPSPNQAGKPEGVPANPATSTNK
jgi:protein-disulfide isomerase